MSTSSIPLRCQDPEGCARWAAERAKVMAERLPQAERFHEAFLQRLAAQPPTSAWEIRIHGQERQVFRAIGQAEVEEVLLCGRPIEAAWVPQGGTILLLGETAAGRPLHLACQFLSPRGHALWVWRIATVYDPRTEAFRWSADWSQRLCRCHPIASPPATTSRRVVQWKTRSKGGHMDQTFDELLPDGEALPLSCWNDGLECQKVPVVGGVTVPFLVKRDQEGGAPLLVMVHHFPAERCVRCGEETTNGTLAAAFERELQKRFQRGEPIPAEMDFRPVAA